MSCIVRCPDSDLWDTCSFVHNSIYLDSVLIKSVSLYGFCYTYIHLQLSVENRVNNTYMVCSSITVIVGSFSTFVC